jgi:hypothetical protein
MSLPLLLALSPAATFYIFMGIMVVLALVSGIFVYHSIFMAHTQHGHDDEH